MKQANRPTGTVYIKLHTDQYYKWSPAMLYLSSAGVGPPPSVGKSSSLFTLGAVFFLRGVGLADPGESLELALPPMPALIDGGTYFPGLAGVVSDLLSSALGVAAEIIFAGLNNCLLLPVHHNKIPFWLITMSKRLRWKKPVKTYKQINMRINNSMLKKISHFNHKIFTTFQKINKITNFQWIKFYATRMQLLI